MNEIVDDASEKKKNISGEKRKRRKVVKSKAVISTDDELQDPDSSEGAIASEQSDPKQSTAVL